MSVVARSLVRLYPDAFRERWGALVEEEAHGAGWKSWPDLIAGIAHMWLHPAVWPADSPAQRQRRVATMGITVALAACFLSHLVAEQGGPLPADGVRKDHARLHHAAAARHRPGRPQATADPGGRNHPAALGGSAPRGADGARRDRRRPGARWRRCDGLATDPAHRRARRLVDRPGTGRDPDPRIFTGVGADAVVPPHPGRLRLGVWTLAAASATGGATILGASLAADGLHLLGAAVGVGLLLLTAVCAGTLRDLRDLLDLASTD